MANTLAEEYGVEHYLEKNNFDNNADKDLIKEKAMKENRNVSSYIRSIFYEKIKKEKGVNENGKYNN